MASLSDDILIKIFKKLNNIDDCLHLGRCCRRFYILLDQNRRAIMRCVIKHVANFEQLQSNVHKYDIRLCHFKDAYWTWASQYLEDFHKPDNRIPLESHPPHSSFTAYANAETLSDQQVWDIVARWQGLALLRDIYLDPSIHQTYCESPFSHFHLYDNLPGGGGTRQLRDELIGEQALDVQEEFLKHSYISAADDQDNVPAAHGRDPSVPERFYMALTGYWLICEAMRFAGICRYPLQTQENQVWDHIDALWHDGRTLREVFHMIEVHDFVYDYLIRQLQCARADTFTQWVESQDYVWPVETTETNWVYFLHDMRLMLTPPDVIELLILTSQWRQSSGQQLEWAPNEKSGYLKVRLFFDSPFFGQVGIANVTESPDTSYTVRDLEEKFEMTLQRHLGALEGSFQNMWTDYRRNKWRTDARGKALLWGTSDRVIADRIRRLSGVE